MPFVSMRFLFVCSLVLLLGHGAYGEGSYQRTKDRKTIIWNNDPQPGDIATWSGDRDADRYANGFGTLTWYTAKQRLLTGSNIPTSKSLVFGRYSGTMVHGKFEGPVNVESKGKIAHAKFVDGKRTNNWADGPAPERKVAEKRTEPVGNDADVDAEPPAQGPTPVRPQPTKQPVTESTVKQSPTEFDESLRSLIGPPASLRVDPVAEASPEPSISSTPQAPPLSPSLTAAEVIGLADAEARIKGYDVGEFQRPQAQYSAPDHTWSVSYDQESVDRNGMGKTGKHFKVSVEDKTKKASVAAGR